MRHHCPRSGFTLVSLVIALTVLAACAAIAGHYYEGMLHESRLNEAKVRMRKIRDAFMLWQVRKKGKEPANLNELSRFVDSNDLVDPWGNEFILDTTARLIICRGADGKHSDGGQGGNDDLIERLPPPVVLSRTERQGSTRDMIAPFISRVFPQGPTVQRRPMVGAQFGDSGSGIDSEMTVLTVDDEDVTAESRLDGSSIHWTPPTDLTTGLHRAFLKVQDQGGNVSQRPWNFSIVR